MTLRTFNAYQNITADGQRTRDRTLSSRYIADYATTLILLEYLMTRALFSVSSWLYVRLTKTVTQSQVCKQNSILIRLTLKKFQIIP